MRAASGSVLHGLDGIPVPVEVPENTVVHQVPVRTPAGRRGVVIRVYGVEDDPKASVASWNATWFGRPMVEELRSLGMDLGRVWPGLPAHEWTLWNAQLFPVTTVEEAWACAQWLLRVSGGYSIERWATGAALAGFERPVGGQRGTRSRQFAALKSALVHIGPLPGRDRH